MTDVIDRQVDKDKVVIIGAGIAGLSAGCWFQQNGYESEIYEMHNLPGGLCTSWKIKDYNIDGCVHWIWGTGEFSPFYKFWDEIIDMKKTPFKDHELFIDIELKNNRDKYGSNIFHVYGDMQKLESYFRDIAPEDNKMITKFIAIIRKFQEYEIPPMMDKPPKLRRFSENMKFVKLLPMANLMLKWKRITNYKFAAKFKSPFLREGFEQVFEGRDLPMVALLMQLAFRDKKAGGFPIGGSLKFSKRIEESYLALGGRIFYNSKVKKIIVENNKAQGVELADGTKIAANRVISCCDWYYTVFEALDGRYTNKSIMDLKNQKKLTLFSSGILLSLGVARSFKEDSHLTTYRLDDPLVSDDGTVYDRIQTHIYNYDPTIAPEGKTIIAINLFTKNGNHWIDLRKKDKEEYKRRKAEMVEKLINILEEKIGNIKEYIEVVDMCTPATFYRFTNNWQGSMQGWFPSKSINAPFAVKTTIPGLSNFHFTGHWTMPGGGLPVALKSARDTVQIICSEDGKEFVAGSKDPYKITSV